MCSSDLEQRHGIWVSREMMVINHRDSTMSMLKTEKLALNFEMDLDLLELRALNDASFRETELKSVRAAAR